MKGKLQQDGARTPSKTGAQPAATGPAATPNEARSARDAAAAKLRVTEEVLEELSHILDEDEDEDAPKELPNDVRGPVARLLATPGEPDELVQACAAATFLAETLPGVSADLDADLKTDLRRLLQTALQALDS